MVYLPRPVAAAALVLLLAPPSRGATRVLADGPGSTVDERAQAWHREHERDSDYSESWFLLVQPRGGGLLIVTVFVSNLGLRTFDGGYDLAWYGPAGETASAHEEVHRDAITGAERGLDLRVGGAHLKGGDGVVSLIVDDPAAGLALELRPRLPPVQLGDGRIALDDGRVFHHGFQVPRASVAGTLHAGGAKVVLDGEGFADHLWTTVKLPSMLTRFQTLRVLDPRLTLVVYDQELARRYGGGHARFGLVGRDGAVLAGVRDLTYTITSTRRDPGSGLDVPASIALEARGGGLTVRGTLEESRFLEAVDVLGRLSWPVRTAIKVFYARPWSLRYLARYRLDVTGPDGVTTHLEGVAPLECNYY